MADRVNPEVQARKTRGSLAFHNGIAAEDLAVRLYDLQSGQVLARRARTPAGELDMIVAVGGQTVFVEVKARRTLEEAAHALSRRQQNRIGLAAQSWLAKNGRTEDNIRFDVVLVDRQGGAEIVENALSFDG